MDDMGDLTARVERAFQDIGPGIELYNVLAIEEMLNRLKAGAPEKLTFDALTSMKTALRGTTVLNRPKSLEQSFRDLTGFWETLVRMADRTSAERRDAPAAVRKGVLVPDDSRGEAMMSFLSSLEELRRILMSQSREGSLSMTVQEGKKALDILSSPEARAIAAASLDRAVEEAFMALLA